MADENTFSEHLARICRELAEQPLPGEVWDKAKLCLLDHLAALLYGTRSRIGDVGRGVLDLFGQGGATLIASKQTSSIQGATFFHGLIATAEDLDDAHRYASGIHLSAVTIPAALALAEDRQLPGERLLRAIVAGYEVAGRVSRTVDSGLRAGGWHSTGAVGPFGSCAACSVLLGLDQAGVANALGIAASGAGGLFAFLHEGASVRHVHGAWASTNGLAAAVLAASGMTGPLKVLEGEDGYLFAYVAASDPRFIIAPWPADSGKDETLNTYYHSASAASDPKFIIAPSPAASGKYEILNTYHKLYACCGHAYPAITAALALRTVLLSRLDAITKIEARVYKASAALTNPAPRSVEEAKFSLPYLLAITLIHGDVSYRTMSDETISDPAVRALATRIVVQEDSSVASAFPRLRSAELVLTMGDGSEIRKYVDAPLGMPENPVGWNELEGKFLEAAEGVLSARHAARIVASVRGVDRLASVSEITHLLKG